jgi:uncharacterized membrane protein
MNVVVWFLRSALAAIFLLAGIQKATQPRGKLAKKLPRVGDYSPSTVRVFGIPELLGAIGLVVPAATGILPALTPTAATGLSFVMVLAVGVTLRHREPVAIAFTLPCLSSLLLQLGAGSALTRFEKAARFVLGVKTLRCALVAEVSTRRASKGRQNNSYRMGAADQRTFHRLPTS